MLPAPKRQMIACTSSPNRKSACARWSAPSLPRRRRLTFRWSSGMSLTASSKPQPVLRRTWSSPASRNREVRTVRVCGGLAVGRFCWHRMPQDDCATIGNEMKLEVECYSGGKADERPVRFRLNGREYVVEDVLDQWYGPQDVFFKLRADDGNLYILRQQTSTPDLPWYLVSFRRLSEDR